MTEPKDKSPSQEQTEAPILAVVDRAREEIAWVRSAYKFAVSIIAILIAIGLYFSHKSIQDLKSELRADGDRIQNQLKTEASLQARTLEKDLEEEVDRIRSQVTKRIEDEFKQENISSLVEEQAQVRIDAIADKIIETQINARITPLKEDLTFLISQTSSELDARVKNLDQKINQSQATEK